ncbi:MAG: DUF167 domain-containing protein [Armatimonadetes bacterium]|nr:DUF167 domain-containing protein [Armatimonadota bacterium]
MQSQSDGSGKSVTVQVKLTPGASREAIEWDGQGWKAWVRAKPKDNEANGALVKLFSKSLKIPKSKVVLIRGHKSREKVLEIDGIDEIQLKSKLGFD